MPDNKRAAVLERAIDVCLNGDFEELPELFTEDVVAWSPTILATSRDDLAAALAAQDSAFSDIRASIDSLDVVGNKGFVEFRVTAEFTAPFVVGDEVIEPTGGEIVLGSALVAEFDGDRISAYRNYFDELSLLSQMIGE
jgi:ketosteroid isomerase-like protein